MINGEGGQGEAIDTSMMDQSKLNNNINDTGSVLRQEYEGKLASLERERETIEEEKAQVDRYKQLLLKQRDIMIALTQRLVERDEQIMGLQDELDESDKDRKDLEEKLDEKTALLIKFQRISMEVNANSPNKNTDLLEALNEWSKINQGSSESSELSNRNNMEGKTKAPKRVSSNDVLLNDKENDSEADTKRKLRQLQDENNQLQAKVLQLSNNAFDNDDIVIKKSDEDAMESKMKDRFDVMLKEREAIKTIMEQKINVLVQSVSQEISTILQGNPQSRATPAAINLAKDVAALQRLVSASIAALKNAATGGQQPEKKAISTVSTSLYRGIAHNVQSNN